MLWEGALSTKPSVHTYHTYTCVGFPTPCVEAVHMVVPVLAPIRACYNNVYCFWQADIVDDHSVTSDALQYIGEGSRAHH